MSVHMHAIDSLPLVPSGGPSPWLPTNAGFDQAVDVLLEEIGYRENPYFAALGEKRFDRGDFVETQIAFCHQVAMFNRAMMLAATHVALPERRLDARALHTSAGERSPSQT